MITPAEIFAFIKAFPTFVNFAKDVWGKMWDEFKKAQMASIDNTKDEKIKELETQIARIKNAQTNDDIAAAIAALNRR